MAIKATIFKADIQVSDMDRHYYQDHSLTIARHPSESDERMMVRLLAFGLHAHEHLSFTKGICSDDEPDLWQKDFSDTIQVWIDLGQPDEKRIRKACGRAEQVYIYTYNERSAHLWWKSVADKLKRFDNLKVILIPDASVQAIGSLAQRQMQLQYTMQDAEILLSHPEGAFNIAPQVLN